MTDKPTTKRAHRLAVPAVTAALLVVFGAGAYIAAGGGGFNPRGLVGGYGSGTADAGTSYHIDSTETGDGANGHDAQGEDDESADEQTPESLAQTVESTQDAFTDTGNASGAASTYNVTGAENGTRVAVNNGGSSKSQDGEPGVIVVPDSGGSTDKGDSDSGSGDGGSDSGGKDGSGSKDNSRSRGDSAPSTKPSATDNSYNILPNDPEPNKSEGVDSNLFPNKAGTDAEEIEQAEEGSVTVNINPSDKQQLYFGQKLNAWTIFCALNTTYTYRAAGSNSSTGYRWECTQEEFDAYPYFQIVSWTDAEGNANPAICPQSDLSVTVRYRFSETGEWHEQTVTCTPEASRVYILGETREDGTATILGWSDAETLNLLAQDSDQLSIDAGTEDLGTSITGRALRDLDYVRDDDTLTHLLLGWEEAGEELGSIYTVTPGRHVIQPSGFTELDEGYSVRLQNYQLQFGDDETVYASTLQTLVNVDESALASDGEAELELTVPEGVQAVDDARDDLTRATACSLGTVELPASALYYNTDGPFIVQERYTVDEGSASYASTGSGILTNKDGSTYAGIPAADEELDVPSGVRRVQVQQVNSLNLITVHGTDGEAPTLQTDNLRNCALVVDDDIFDAFIEANYAALTACGDGGLLMSRASDPEAYYTCLDGMIYSKDDLVRVNNNGSNTVFVQTSTTIKTGAFEGTTDVSYLVLFSDGDYVLEPDSLAGGNIATIFCFTEKQAAGIEAQLTQAGAPDARVIVAQMSAEDMLYYYAEDGAVTLFSDQGLAESFDGTVTDEDGSKVSVNTIASHAFAGNTSLAQVSLGFSVTSIESGAFAGCSSLASLQLDSATPASLTLASPDTPFCFTDSAEDDELMGISVPAGSEASYLAAWIYPCAGYADYDDCYAKVQRALTQEQGACPAETQVRERMAQELLAPENHLRRMLSLPEVEASTVIVDSTPEPEGEYEFTSGENGAYTLTAAPTGAVTADLDAVVPEDCTSLTIAAGAFEACTNLERVDLGTKVSSIESGAFAGCDGVTVAVAAGRAANIALAGGSADAPFTFGASIVLEVPEAEREALLAAWPMQSLGYTSSDELDNWAFRLAWSYIATGSPISKATAYINDRLLEQENYLRGLMGLDLISTTDQLTYQYEFSW